MFPFLISELSEITGPNHRVVCDVDGWPVAVLAQGQRLGQGLGLGTAQGQGQGLGQGLDKGSINVPSSTVSRGNVSRGYHEGGQHPALFPILLLLSKMRAAIENSSTPTNNNNNNNNEGFSHHADLSLFTPLLEHCARAEPTQKVRET